MGRTHYFKTLTKSIVFQEGIFQRRFTASSVLKEVLVEFPRWRIKIIIKAKGVT